MLQAQLIVTVIFLRISLELMVIAQNMTVFRFKRFFTNRVLVAIYAVHA